MNVKSLPSGFEGACRPGVEAQRMCCFPKGFLSSHRDSFIYEWELLWEHIFQLRAREFDCQFPVLRLNENKNPGFVFSLNLGFFILPVFYFG